jgi:hypothetical protein
MARPGCRISMSIKLIAKDKEVLNTKCPSPGCTGRSVQIDNGETFSCQKCDLTYSMLPEVSATDASIRERRSPSKIYGLIPYWRRAQTSETSHEIVGVDQQTACFKKVHILAPAMSEISTESTSTVRKSPLRGTGPTAENLSGYGNVAAVELVPCAYRFLIVHAVVSLAAPCAIR